MANQEAMRLWVEALRSGQYRQGKSKLRTNSGKRAKHCCLGVLCEIARAQNVKVPRGWAAMSFLPESVVEWAQLEYDDPVLETEYEGWTPPSGGEQIQVLIRAETASYANDSLQRTFEQIADMIENHLIDGEGNENG